MSFSISINAVSKTFSSLSPQAVILKSCSTKGTRGLQSQYRLRLCICPRRRGLASLTPPSLSFHRCQENRTSYPHRPFNPISFPNRIASLGPVLFGRGLIHPPTFCPQHSLCLFLNMVYNPTKNRKCGQASPPCE